MYDPKDTQFVGKYDYDKDSAEDFASHHFFKSFSIGVFRWELKNNGNSMKRGKVAVRVSGPITKKKDVFEMADNIVKALDAGDWDGRKTVVLK
jgi:hypothetical protein